MNTTRRAAYLLLLLHYFSSQHDVFSFTYKNHHHHHSFGGLGISTTDIEIEPPQPTTLTTTTSSYQYNLPQIHWTVPGFKVGWQDEDGNWMDEDGPRKGPPMNYWRQKSDERLYEKDMNVIRSVLSSSSCSYSILPPDYDDDDDDDEKEEIGRSMSVEKAIQTLEKSCHINKPSFSRKMLGTWAPLIRSGTRTVQPHHQKTLPDYLTRISAMEITIEFPWLLDVFRTTGRKLAPPSRYGVFDASFVEGEYVTFRSSGLFVKDDGDDGGCCCCASDASVCVRKDNEVVELGTLLEDGNVLCYGGITYLSDYLMLQRGKGDCFDLWMRCDEAYLGKN